MCGQHIQPMESYELYTYLLYGCACVLHRRICALTVDAATLLAVPRYLVHGIQVVKAGMNIPSEVWLG